MDETTTAVLVQFASWLYLHGSKRIEGATWERAVADLSPELQVGLFARWLRQQSAAAAAITIEGEDTKAGRVTALRRAG